MTSKIIQIRGTSGSGKSTLVRNVMSRFAVKLIVNGCPDGKPRKQPIGYRLHSDRCDLFVPGHYETPCGGTDTITKADFTMGLIREHALAYNVLFEGLLLSADVNKVASLLDLPCELHAIVLNPPLEACLAGVNERRLAKHGEGFKPVPMKNTASKHKGVISTIERLHAAGVHVHVFESVTIQQVRERALAKVVELLNVGP